MAARRLLLRAGLAALLPFPCAAAREPALEIVAAPSNLGLRPPRPGHEPGAWRAPDVLLRAGLRERLAPAQVHYLPRPAYHFEAQAGTQIRNGQALRQFNLSLAHEVAAVLSRGRFPLVLGGDCSILLGCLFAARQGGLCGLIHMDGHSDFGHPGNYGSGPGLHSAAGMDLALASGRGEPVLADWGKGFTPLVADEHIVQIGEREGADPDYAYPDIRQTRIRRIDISTALAQGMDKTARQALERFEESGLRRVWLHVDVDVLDQRLMPAVDSPGSPGLDFAGLTVLIRRLRESSILVGADVSIFDPELDPDGIYARRLSQCIADAFL